MREKERDKGIWGREHVDKDKLWNERERERGEEKGRDKAIERKKERTK